MGDAQENSIMKVDWENVKRTNILVKKRSDDHVPIPPSRLQKLRNAHKQFSFQPTN